MFIYVQMLWDASDTFFLALRALLNSIFKLTL